MFTIHYTFDNDDMFTSVGSIRDLDCWLDYIDRDPNTKLIRVSRG